MRSKLIFPLLYLTCIPVLVFALIAVVTMNSIKPQNAYVFKSQNSAFRALPEKNEATKSITSPQEWRVEALKQFFDRYESVLSQYATEIVAAADTYEIDYRLLPAIAMQESILCARTPKDSHNCWGWGIYGGKVTRFASYSEAIESITKQLASKYKSHGLEEPHEIVSKYNPSNTNNWNENVSYVMDRIESTF